MAGRQAQYGDSAKIRYPVVAVGYIIQRTDMQIKENTPRDSRGKYTTKIYKKIYLSLVY